MNWIKKLVLNNHKLCFVSRLVIVFAGVIGIIGYLTTLIIDKAVVVNAQFSVLKLVY